MAKISEQQLKKELSKKHLTMVSEYSEYKNINNPMRVKCMNNHLIETNLKTIRSSTFTCPVCVGQATKGFEDQPLSVPPKKGFRVVAFDNATHNVGVSIFDSGNLVYYAVFRFNNGSAMHRMNKIRDMLENRAFPL